MDGLEQIRGSATQIAALAERQHGVVARRQLLALGVSEDSIEVRLRQGGLHRLYRGVYAVGHRVLSVRGHWLAAVLACGPHAVLSHRSAAAHWSIRDYWGAYVDVTSPSKTRSRGSIRRHCAPLLADEVTKHEGIPITSASRTIFDLAVSSTPQSVEAALRQSEYLRLYSPLSLWDLVERYPRHRGTRSIRTALASLESTPGEVYEGLEQRFLAFLDTYVLPRPHLNAWLEVQGHRYKLDCLWPEQRLIAELDSWQAHGTRASFQSDKSRDRRLAVAGYRTTRITWQMFTNEPELLAADLRTLLA